jgi:hypothetical protein
MGTPASIGDLAHLEQRLMEHQKAGFQGLNDRIDNLTAEQRRTNGRVGRLEDRLNDDDDGIGATKTKIKNLEREVYTAITGAAPSAHAVLSPVDGGKKDEPAELLIRLTPRMWKILLAVGGAFVTVGPMLGEWIRGLVMHIASGGLP